MRNFNDDNYRLWQSVLFEDTQLTDIRRKRLFVIADIMLESGIPVKSMENREGFANGIYTLLDTYCSETSYDELFIGLVCGQQAVKVRKSAQPTKCTAVQQSKDSPYVKFNIEFVDDMSTVMERTPREGQVIEDKRIKLIGGLVLNETELSDMDYPIAYYIYKNLWHINNISGRTNATTCAGVWKQYLRTAITEGVYDLYTLLFLSTLESVDIVDSQAFDNLYVFMERPEGEIQYHAAITYDLSHVNFSDSINNEETVYNYHFIPMKKEE